MKCEFFYVYNFICLEMCDIVYCFGKIFDSLFEKLLVFFI